MPDENKILSSKEIIFENYEISSLTYHYDSGRVVWIEDVLDLFASNPVPSLAAKSTAAVITLEQAMDEKGMTHLRMDF